MTNPFGNKFVKHSAEDEAALLEQRAKELAGGEKSARIKIKDGMNVLWILPKMGEMASAIDYRFVHYKPFHLCRRDNPSPDPKDTKKLLEDKAFSKCPRCRQAWDTWSALGKPRNCEEHELFKRDMPSVQALVQAVNLTPFFGSDSSKTYAVPKIDLIEKWGAAFVETIRTGEVPDGMPEDIAEAALAGVNPLFVSKELGGLIRSAYNAVLIESDEGEDPLFKPGSTLLQISRSDSGATFESGGRTIKSKTHEVRFTLDKFMKTWVIPEGFIEACVDKAQDLTQLEVEGDTVEDKARALHKLSPEEITELLNNAGHSFTPSLTASDVDEAVSGFKDVSSPDDFVSSALSTSANRDLNELRRSKE